MTALTRRPRRVRTDGFPATLDARQGMGGPTVAVRSSGTAEDLATASVADQYATFLDVVEPEAGLDAVRRRRASLWSERAVTARASPGQAAGRVRVIWSERDFSPPQEDEVLVAPHHP